MNPFLQPYNTPHDTTPFHLIKDEHFEAALLEGMRREDAEIDAIINNPEPATFANTLLALEYSGELMGRVDKVMSNLLSACTNDRLEALAQKMAPMLTEHYSRIVLNSQLFNRIKHVRDSHPTLSAEEQTLLDKVYEGFVRRGVGLPQKDKERLTQISTELSVKMLQFSQNLLKDTNRFQMLITDKEQLAGLPDLQMELAHANAQEAGKEGWLFNLQAPSYRPLLTYCDNRSLRRKAWMAHSTLCIKKNRYNNLDLARDIVNLRLENARLLGNKSHAHYTLKLRMAKNPETVNKFLDTLLRAYKPTAQREYKELCEFARRLEGPNFKVRPWDVAYYSHKLQLERYNFDSEMLRPYFELSNVIKGVFGLATRLYGITFKVNKNIPVYHNDVVAYEVFDQDGQFLAVLYADFHPRSNKKSGAWMTNYKEQYFAADGTNVRPHVSLNMNLTKPTKDKPSLLTLDEVSTFLHEFGHGLHSIFSQCRFETLSGTNVPWDFVELPSQFMENYALEKEFLKTFAFHYQTGEALPEEMIDRVIESRHYHVGMSCLRQISFSLLDMAYYTRTKPLDQDIIEFETKAIAPTMLGNPSKRRTCTTVQFQHIMNGGYSAGYYCYKWAEVLDADAFSAFQEEGIFNKETAARFRHEILERGNTLNPRQLFRNFRHRRPSIKAMLRRDGIKLTSKSKQQ